MIYKTLNIKNIIFITTSLFFLCQSSFSQSSDWMSEYETDALEVWNITYNKPINFTEVIGGNDCFENNSKLKALLVCGGNQLLSKNNRVVVFNMVGSIFTKKPENGQIIKLYSSKSLYKGEKFYISYVKNDINQSLGKEAALNWEDHVNYYSKKETLNKFNAEMAISYSINLQPKDYYKGKYNNLWVLLLRKGGRFVRMYCFYKDMSKRKLAKYKTEIEGIFRYND